MARSNSGDNLPNQSMSPFHTPPGGMPMPVPGNPLNYAGQPNQPVTPVRSGPTPLGLLHALKRRWVLAGLIGGLAATIAAVVVWMALPAGKHEARAHVQIKFNQPDGITKAADDPESFRRTQVFILKTRDLINRTLAEPSVASLPMVRNSEDPVKMLEEGLKVTTEGPEIISVSLTGDEPDDMRIILDQLLKRYIDDATVTERRSRDDRLRKLEKMIETFKSEIRARENQIRLMVESSNVTSPEDGSIQAARLTTELSRLDGEVYAAKKEIDELRSQIDGFKKKLDTKRYDFTPLEIDHAVDSDQEIAQLFKQKFEKEFILKKVEAVAINKNDPAVSSLRDSITDLDKQIVKARTALRPQVELEFKNANEAMIRKQIGALEDKISTTEKFQLSRETFRTAIENRLKTGQGSVLNISALQKEVDPMRMAQTQLESQAVGVRFEQQQDSRVSVRQSAYFTLNKNLKQKILIASGAGLATLFAVLALIGFLEWRTRRIDGVDQVVTELGMRIIGTVPAFPNRANLRAAEVAGGANWRFALNESINSTRTMLLHAARSQSMQVVMVTSATQGEGKTSLSSQLGTSMATAGMRTLIVDCDLRNPSIHKLFDLGLSTGVSEVLCQEADVSDAVQPTTVPNLWVIPAGQCSNRVINALAQGHPLETLFNRLRGQFDFIIVDSCPVLPVADALLIGQHVDGVLFSIMQDISQLPKVITASEKLAQLNIPLVGAVVNGIRQNTYSYGYNYVKQLPA